MSETNSSILLAQASPSPHSGVPPAAPIQMDGATSPNPSPTPPADAAWKCDLKAIDEKGDTVDLTPEITVGSKMLLSCDGASIDLKADKLKIENPKETQYALVLLEPKEVKATGGSFVVTSWAAGEFKFDPVLTDGTKRVELGKIELKIATVITDENNPEKKPYPPLGVLDITWPIWVWSIFGVVGFGFLALIVLAIRISLRRKRLIKLLEQHATPLSPYHQFNKEFRKLVKELPTGGDWPFEDASKFFNELDSSFRWFIARELVIPAIETSPTRVLKELNSSDSRTYKAVKKDLFLALSELEKAKKASVPSKATRPPATEDALQISELCRVVAHQITTERST